MRRTRLVRGLVIVGFVVLAVELGLAAFSSYRSMHPVTKVPHHVVVMEIWPSVLGVYLPTALLLVAALGAGTVLYRAFHNRARASWFTAVLAPLAALLVTRRPSYGVLHARQAFLPWAAPYYLTSWSPELLSLALQIAVYALLPIYAAAALMSLEKDTEGERRRLGFSSRTVATTRQ